MVDVRLVGRAGGNGLFLVSVPVSVGVCVRVVVTKNTSLGCSKLRVAYQ